MDISQFYTPLAEGLKVAFYLGLAGMVLYGLFRKRQGKSGWADWIHAAIIINFLVGAWYSGLRMLTTDEIEHMLIRRMFAWEAWFNFGCVSMYFLVLTRRRGAGQ